MLKYFVLFMLAFVSYSSIAQELDPKDNTAICEGDNLTLTVKNFSGTPTFKWFKSVNGSPYDLIANESKDKLIVSQEGSYKVVLSDKDTLGPIAVTVNKKPVIDFSFDNNICSGEKVNFKSSINGGKAPYTYTWNFGDSKTSSIKDPSHVFFSLGCSTGSFDVILTVTDANGCSQTKTQKVTVKQAPGLNFEDSKNPFSQFNNCANSPTLENPDFSITLKNISNNNGCISSYTVDWGDGNILKNLKSSDFPIDHTYKTLGSFNLKITGFGTNGCQNVFEQKVVNQSNPAVGISAPGNTTGCAPIGFWFKLKGYEYNSPGTSYEWNFGDGTPIINMENPSLIDSINHLFSQTSCTQNNGQYIVSVTAINGCKSTKATVDNITVFERPKADFSPPAPGCINKSVFFKNISIQAYNNGNCSRTTNFEWDFGDGQTSTQPEPNHTYTTPGKYKVKLVAIGSCGRDSISKEICISGNPTSSFTLDQLKGCGPLKVNATNTSNTLGTCGSTTYNWSVTYQPLACGTIASVKYLNNTNASSQNPSFEFANPGEYTLTLSVTNSCGTVTSSQKVNVTKPPVISFSGGGDYCGIANINPVATVTNCGNNALTYKWTFEGGTPAISTNPNPGNVSFSSIGDHKITLEVTNECGTTSVTNIVKVKPVPEIKVPVNIIECPESNISSLNFAGSVPNTIYSWTNDNANIGLALSGTGSVIPSFKTINSTNNPIVGKILINSNINGCTNNQQFSITVNPKPAPPGTTNISYFQDETATALTANASGNNTLKWYTTANGGTPVTAPIPNTSIAGKTIYYVSQVNSFLCESNRAAIEVNIAATPKITASKLDPSQCNSSTGSITIKGIAANTTYTVNYLKNGSPISANINSNLNGEIVLSNLAKGEYSEIYITIGKCSSNKVGPFTLSDPLPPAKPDIVSNSPVCSGGTLKLTGSTTSNGAIVYSWNGPNGFVSNLKEPSILNATTAASGTYQLTVSLNGCLETSSHQVIINPTPNKPIVKTPFEYCQNALAAILTATAEPNNSLVWYDNPGLTNGSSTAPVPSTSAIGTITYYVTQKTNQACESNAATITVSTYGIVNGNSIGTDQTICSGTIAAQLSGTVPVSGGNGAYTYQWQRSIDGGATFTDISGATSENYLPGSLTATTKFRRKVISGPCEASISNSITISVQGELKNYEIQSPQTICTGTVPLKLTGNKPSGGDGNYKYQWQQSSDNITWNNIAGETNEDYQPLVLNNSTYFRRQVISGQCSLYSSAVLITVNPKPAMNIPANILACNNSNINSIILSSSPSTNVTYQWENNNTSIGLGASGSGNIPSFLAKNNDKKPIESIISLTPTYAFNNTACQGEKINFIIEVLPSISIKQINDTIVCTGSPINSIVPENDAENTSGAKVSYRWTVSGQGISLTNGDGETIPSFTTLNVGSADLIATITITPQYSFKGKTCDGQSRSFKITVKPGTPSANAGPDQQLCAATEVNLKADLPNGVTGTWTQIGTPLANIIDPSNPSTKVTGLTPGNTYRFEWKINGFANCLPSTDFVEVINYPPVINKIDDKIQTICSGQSVTIKGENPSGGNNNYLFQWKQSKDGVLWMDVTGETGNDLTVTPLINTYYKRNIISGPCISESTSVLIKVQPGISNNIISGDQNVCIDNAGSIIKGSQPAGGNGIYLYQWEESTDNGLSWNEFSGETNIDLNPGVLLVSKQYRRKVSTDLCNGPQVSKSNIVTINVRLDSKAEFDPIALTGCTPFAINAGIINLKEYADRNGKYLWYADGKLIGNGIVFPGYTLNNSGDSVKITLRTESMFGCKPDSMEHKFYTLEIPTPSFTLSDTSGCGPLSVVIKNTTTNTSFYKYEWDLGNGTKVYNEQPGTVIYPSNPTYADTTYTIRLRVITQCDTLSYSKQIIVHSKPKALFAPDKSVGCSPMNVVFNNTSLGLGNKYTWDFGDGTIVSTITRDTISHTYNTGIKKTFYPKLIVSNDCGVDTISYAIVVSPNTIKLDFAVNGNEQEGCAPLTVRFINNSKGATLFNWNFGDGTSLNTKKNIDTIVHTFASGGTYSVVVMATNGCSDTVSTEVIKVFPSPKAKFNLVQTESCSGDTVRFINSSEDANSYLWNFGDGVRDQSKDPVHVFKEPGNYTVLLKAFQLNEGGYNCEDSSFAIIQVIPKMPAGNFSYSSGYICDNKPAKFEANVLNTDSLVWNFGDGTILRTKGRLVFHTYTNPGVYIPSVTLISYFGCSITISGKDSIKADKVSGSFNWSAARSCGSTEITFRDTSSMYFGKAAVRWNFGDGTSGTGLQVKHVYTASGNYKISKYTQGLSGCMDTIVQDVKIDVSDIPVASIVAPDAGCNNLPVAFNASISSTDKINLTQWTLSNGSSGNTVPWNIRLDAGTYDVKLIAGTVNGCYDTAYHSMKINSAPTVIASGDVLLCKGSSAKLTVTGAATFNWSPIEGLSCTNCTDPVAKPMTSTPYIVRGTNPDGCYSEDTVRATVIQPFKMELLARDSICIGESTQLIASGADIYAWSPADGLSNTSISNPTAAPEVTTKYRVIGYDKYNCFTDTSYVTVAVGNYPTIDLGPDRILSTGTMYPLSSVVTNGPIQNWLWTPGTNLNCATCPQPVAEIKKNISYIVNITNQYGCTATDTINIKVFCENAQVFIPNAFTPDNDGINDVLTVRGTGIVMVKYFRIFNRWGELVFDRNNFPPNDRQYAWDGKIKGVINGPDVFVYTAEVVCENGTTMIYKGNVSLLK